MQIKFINAVDDWPAFLKTANDNLTFAPYTVPFKTLHVEKIFAPFINNNDTLCVIGADGDSRGVAHISVPPGENETAILHLLLADTNNLAQALLAKAENWAAERKIKKIRSHAMRLNPYRCLMHGTESYCWGGLYTARNAFARQKWDLELDIINMRLDIAEPPEVFDPGLEGFNLTEGDFFEDSVSSGGVFRVMLNEMPAASCGCTFLKEISGHLGKGIGQIWINSPAEFHGTGAARQAITAAHKKLYETGARKIILATNNALFRAVKFYQSLGYKHELIHAFTYVKEL